MPIARALNRKSWKKLWIQNPGLISIEEFRQAIWTDLGHLEKVDGAEFVQDPLICLPVVNQYGDLLNITNEQGTIMRKIHSHAYKCAALDFQL